MIEKERQIRLIGYGGMLMESFVAIMALIAAISIDRGLYFAMNAPAGADRRHRRDRRRVRQQPRPVRRHHHPRRCSPQPPQTSARSSIVSRTGGAPTLAVGMAEILQQFFGGTALKALLVPLRDHVRGAVHPHHRRRRHPGRAVHAAGHARQLRARSSRDTCWRPGAWICTAIVVGRLGLHPLWA